MVFERGYVLFIRVTPSVEVMIFVRGIVLFVGGLVLFIGVVMITVRSGGAPLLWARDHIIIVEGFVLIVGATPSVGVIIPALLGIVDVNIVFVDEAVCVL